MRIGDGTTITFGLIFRDFTFRDSSGGVDRLVHIDYGTRSQFYDLTFEGSVGATNGVLLTHEFAWINDFYSPRFSGGYRALQLMANSNAVTFFGANFEQQTNASVWVADGDLINRVNFIGGTVEGSPQATGFLIEYASGSLTIQGMYFENTEQHIQFSQNPVFSGTSATIRDCRFFSGGGTAAIELATAQRIFASNNSFRTQPLVHVNYESLTNDDAVYVGEDNTSFDGSPEVVFSKGSVLRRFTHETGQTFEAYSSEQASSDVTFNGHRVAGIEQGTTATVAAGTSVSVTFDVAFADVPTVVVSHLSATPLDGVLRVSNVTPTGFTVTNDSSTPTAVNYIATGAP